MNNEAIKLCCLSFYINTFICTFDIVAKQMQRRAQGNKHVSHSDSYLLKYSCLVHLFPRDVTHFENTQGKSFEGRLLNKVGVVDVQTGEHCLSQGVTFQPCDLETHKYTLLRL